MDQLNEELHSMQRFYSIERVGDIQQFVQGLLDFERYYSRPIERQHLEEIQRRLELLAKYLT